jgi:copper(I)-binding protein
MPAAGCRHDGEEARVIRSCRGGSVSRRVVIATAVALVPLIAGCEAGTNPPSLQWHAPTDGTGLVIGAITISNAFVLGAPLGSALRPGQNAGLFFGLTNTGQSRDSLIGITAPGVARSVLLPGGHVVVNSYHSVLLSGPRPTVILEDLLRPVTGGSVIKLQLSFAKAGTHDLSVPVMPMAQYYSTLSPPPAPTATTSSPSASPTRPGRHHRRHRTPSLSPSASP